MWFNSFSTPILVILFIAATSIIWIAGTKLTYATDFIANHFKLGEAFGGMVLLAIVTNLPEIAITWAAALNHEIELAISNIIGGIAIQTVVLAFIDRFGIGKKSSLSSKANSSNLLLEGIFLIFILTLIIIGSLFPKNFQIGPTSPIEWIIFISWIIFVYYISKQSRHPSAHPRKKVYPKSLIHEMNFKNIYLAMGVFIICALATLMAGWALERTGSMIASRFEMTGILFGATILALATALPEISTGIASAKIQDYEMAVSDIFGGNAFLPTLFILASLLSGQSVLLSLSKEDIYLTCIGIILTGIYLYGMVIKNKHQILGIGKDSMMVILAYAISILGLLFLSKA